MATIESIYETYKIPPWLQEHQLRVAAVGKIVAEVQERCDVHMVVTACLLHDMGNIIKFKLDRFPEFLEPHGLTYWQEVQNEYLSKYGKNEHVATEAICHELGVSSEVLHCVAQVGFTRVHEHITDDTREACVVNYADMRVGPRGVISLNDRIADGYARYGNKHDGKELSDEQYMHLVAYHHFTEAALLPGKVRPEAITDMYIAPIVEELKHFTI